MTVDNRLKEEKWSRKRKTKGKKVKRTRKSSKIETVEDESEGQE